MKKAKPARRTPTAKSRPLPKTVDEYIARVPEPGRGVLQKMRSIIRSVVRAEAVEIISYRIPAFKQSEILVWYAAFATHCSLFPKAQTIEAFKSELKGYATSKGTIHFPLDRPLPTDLIKKLVKFRVAQVEAKRAG